MEGRNMNPVSATTPDAIKTMGGAASKPRENNMGMSGMSTKPVSAGIPATTQKPPVMPKADTIPLIAAMESGSTAVMASVPVTGRMQKNPPLMEADGGYKKGELPHYAPLAAGYVPYQQKNPPKYAHGDALTHGTLFPGLDLPFMNVASKNNPYAGTPLGEVMALDFAIHELGLYLDTHEDDMEAFEMQKKLIKLSGEGRRKYEELYGPLDMGALARANRYTWLMEPWPWEYAERMGNK